MQKFKEMLRSPHIQIALAAGASIIILAFFSKRLLSEPIGYIPMAIPPFIASIHAGFWNRHKDSAFFKTRYWVTAIFLATAIVILSYMF